MNNKFFIWQNAETGTTTSIRWGDPTCEKQLLSLEVQNVFGSSVSSIEFNADGNYTFNLSPYSVVHVGTVNIVQTAATEDGSPITPNSNCQITIGNAVAPYTNEISIVVVANTSGFVRTWTFELSDSYDLITLVITQNS